MVGKRLGENFPQILCGAQPVLQSDDSALLPVKSVRPVKEKVVVYPTLRQNGRFSHSFLHRCRSFSSENQSETDNQNVPFR